MERKRKSTFPRVPPEAVETWLKLAHGEQVPQMVRPEDIPPLDPKTPPRQVIELALEQIRSFIAIYSAGPVANDGTVFSVGNGEQILSVVEGFLDFLLSQARDPLLKRMAQELNAVRQERVSPSSKLNSYIGVLRAYHHQTPAIVDVKVAHLALEAEQALVEEALVSPHLSRVSSGAILGDPGVRFERTLLEMTLPWLSQLATAASGTKVGMGAETLLEKARNASLQSIPPGTGLEIVNQILTFCRNLHSTPAGVSAG